MVIAIEVVKREGFNKIEMGKGQSPVWFRHPLKLPKIGEKYKNIAKALQKHTKSLFSQQTIYLSSKQELCTACFLHSNFLTLFVL